MKNISIRVTGRVQGVWFRKYTADKANELGLYGFVKNLPDGSVYIEVSGPSRVVDELETWCWTGSPLSSVQKVEVTECDFSHRSTFTIKS